MPEPWRSIAARKQDERNSRIPREWRLQPGATRSDNDSVLNVPRECGLLTNREIAITEKYDATSLLAELTTGRLKSEDVVRAFCKRAAIAQQLVNCLTEIIFEDALVRARQLDEHYAKTGKPIGPLHGVPVSLKDTFNIRGYDASLGVAALSFKPATTNSALVDLLLAAGAVLYCKTNVPQSLSALDSHNNVFGRTLNPRNMKLTAGGSSGGEGALVGLRGSILGVGTDVGGSIRVPALCNYVYGVKPSHGRVPYAGQASGMKHGSSKLGIEPTAGPLATSLRDCELFFRVVGESAPELYDPEVISDDWRRQVALSSSQRPLCIGIVRTDGHVRPLPPIERLMEEVTQTLRSASRPVEIVELKLSSILSPIVKTFNGIMSMSGANPWMDLFEMTSEPLSPWLQSRIARRPWKTTEQVIDLQAQKSNFQTQFLDAWREDGGYWLTEASKAKRGSRRLDAFIIPVAPHPVPLIDHWNDVNYTGALNLLDLSTGVIPVRTFAEDDMMGEVPSEPPLNGWDKINRQMWDVDRRVYLNSALSVQVVTPRLTEKKLLGVMAVVDEALQPLRARSGRKGKL